MAEKQIRDIQRSSFNSCDRKSLDKVLDRERSISKAYKDVDTDQESGGSSEEMESPKSVANWRKKLSKVHYQIRRIREEDLHLGEDIGEGFNAKEKITWIQFCNHPNPYHHGVSPPMEVVFFSRPSSPLSGKTTLRALN